MISSIPSFPLFKSHSGYYTQGAKEYIPSLHLAFELNGLFHYEPIFSLDKLSKIQNNDRRKFQACLERGIELCIIDTCRLSYFKESNAIPYLDIIRDIIRNKLEPVEGIKPP